MSTSLTTTGRELKADIMGAAESAADRVSDIASRGMDSLQHNVVDPARDLGTRLNTAVHDGVADARQESRRQIGNASSWISRNPLMALTAGIGAGILIGAIARRV